MSQKNQLTDARAYKLTSWIERNQEELQRHKTLNQVGDAATKELGFLVTESNVAGACRVLRIELGGMRSQTRTGASKDKFREVAKLLVRIADDLGIEVPPAVRLLAKR